MFYTFIKYVPAKPHSRFYYKKAGIVTINSSQVTAIIQVHVEVEDQQMTLVKVMLTCGSTFICEPQNYYNFHKIFGEKSYND